MGKHAAPRPDRTSRAVDPNPVAPSPTGTPMALQHAAGFAALAAVVAVLAMLWAGTSPLVAFAVGVGLLVLGGVAFVVIRQTGLLAGRDAAHPRTPVPPPL